MWCMDDVVIISLMLRWGILYVSPLTLIFWEDSPILFSFKGIHLFLVRTVHLSYEPLDLKYAWGVKDLNSHKSLNAGLKEARDEILFLVSSLFSSLYIMAGLSWAMYLKSHYFFSQFVCGDKKSLYTKYGSFYKTDALSSYFSSNFCIFSPRQMIC